MVSRVENQSVYTDLSGLNAITRLGREDTPAAMRQVAQQFESVFLGIMLKAMRDSNAVFAEGNYLQSNEMEFHQQNFDNQLSLHMSEGRGLGLADVLYEQMMSQYARTEKPANPVRPVGASPLAINTTSSYPVRPVGASPLAINTTSSYPVRPVGASPLAKKLIVPEPASTTTLGPTGSRALPEPPVSSPARHGRIASPRDFVKMLYPIAEEAATRIGVDPRVLLAQSALETGWGRRMIAMPDGSTSHNLFGIKADARWSGNRATVNTVEFRDGVAALEKASFRSYGSYEESFRDYVQFLLDNPRYQKALSNTANPEVFAQGLQDAGYATDPVYAKKISRVMNSHTMRAALSELQQPNR
jgi:flagellar protein FlgJ